MSGECNNSALGGGNPCNVKAPLNTAACETLPSQIENFTLEFFGEVFKTEVDGAIQWSLPGRLDVGLPLNPRGNSEPLGCYFIRMFQYGIVGGKGPKGDPGLDGCNGSTPYVQVLAGGFPQPSVGAQFAIKVTRNPSLLPGMDVFVEGSGWYDIVTSDGFGNATVLFRKSVVNPGSWIFEGTVLLPSGKVGETGGQGVQGIKGNPGGVGNQGIQGVTGPVGNPGPAGSAILPTYGATIPTFTVTFPSTGDFPGYQGGLSTSAFTNVVLLPGSVPCTVKLAKPGVYLILTSAGYGAVPGDAGAGLTFAEAKPGINQFRLKNISTNAVIDQSTIQTYTAFVANPMAVTFVTTLTNNNIIQLQAKSITGAAVISVNFFWAFKIS
jgi:hypothetical protein